MANPPPLSEGCPYHIYNRGTNGEVLFRTRDNYLYFLKHYAHYIQPVAETYAYCLMGHHFHLAIRTRTPEEQAEHHAENPSTEPCMPLSPSRQFSKLFSAYAKAFNRAFGRTGSVFEHPFRRKLAKSEGYFWRLITYIHRNPEHHGFVDDYRDWPYSSYSTLLSEKPARLRRKAVLESLGGRQAFVTAHSDADYQEIRELLPEMQKTFGVFETPKVCASRVRDPVQLQQPRRRLSPHSHLCFYHMLSRLVTIERNGVSGIFRETYWR